MSCRPLSTLALITYSPEIFDEYTRRQYIAKAPESNPFGVEEDPEKFIEFDVFTKVGFHNEARSSSMIYSYTSMTRFEFCSNSHNGLSVILIVFERGW